MVTEPGFSFLLVILRDSIFRFTGTWLLLLC